MSKACLDWFLGGCQKVPVGFLASLSHEEEVIKGGKGAVLRSAALQLYTTQKQKIASRELKSQVEER